jgi:hypothetical protein
VQGEPDHEPGGEGGSSGGGALPDGQAFAEVVQADAGDDRQGEPGFLPGGRPAVSHLP